VFSLTRVAQQHDEDATQYSFGATANSSSAQSASSSGSGLASLSSSSSSADPAETARDHQRARLAALLRQARVDQHGSQLQTFQS
jgi:hypothetical protein